MTNTEEFDWNRFQIEVHMWAMKNFDKPDNRHVSHHPLLGIFEEVGELYDSETFEDTIDAVGDVMVYILYRC
jgi:NTP pyrophosphatase (non-canonical NTP hydrolase)